MRFLLLAAETAPAAAETDAGQMVAIAIAFMVAAIGLFFLEILLPSFGVITLVAIACVAGALTTAFSVSRLMGVMFIAVTVVSMPLVVYLAVKVAKRTSLVLKPEDTPGTGGEAGPTETDGLAPGTRGVALTTLRPSGTASFDDRKVSVVTTGEMVEAGVQIEVVQVEGIRTVVRPVRV